MPHSSPDCLYVRTGGDSTRVRWTHIVRPRLAVNRRESLQGVVRITLTLGVLAIPAAALYVAARCYSAEARSFVRQKHPVDPESAREALGEVEAVALPFAGGHLRGVYAPARNRAAVLLCHGSSGDRNALLVEAQALQTLGFGVLLLDSPGHGESDGEVHWSADEVRAVRAAVDYLTTRADVDKNRLGVLGFSMGGYIAAMAAAEEPRLRAVVLSATPTDARVHTMHEYRRWSWVGQRAALWALERHGMDLDGPTPIREIARIAPRPLLIIGGLQDPVVPTSMIRALYAAAREPKQLLMIEGGGHGDYAAVPGSTYLKTLLSFFEHALVSAPPG